MTEGRQTGWGWLLLRNSLPPPSHLHPLLCLSGSGHGSLPGASTARRGPAWRYWRGQRTWCGMMLRVAGEHSPQHCVLGGFSTQEEVTGAGPGSEEERRGQLYFHTEAWQLDGQAWSERQFGALGQRISSTFPFAAQLEVKLRAGEIVMGSTVSPQIPTLKFWSPVPQNPTVF